MAAGPISVWIYSGYKYEELIEDTGADEFHLLRRCQVLVDGKFVEELRDPSLLYRGSSNQRIIDVQNSLSERKITLWEPTYTF
ncbi:anaerobic ribonucleotide reductase-activating protein [compost metagenome]